MCSLKRIASLALAAAFALSASPPLAAAVTPAAAHPLEHSRELWATVDVCSPKDQPDTIGIRGSMPGDGHATYMMYMRFRVQYLDAGTGKWLDLAQGADSGFLRVGSGALTRQAGRSFQFAPTSSRSAFTLRGYVIFQWRKGTTVLETTTRTTSAGHTSLAGADPHGFSAATCVLS
jgi:hypothetical protein